MTFFILLIKSRFKNIGIDSTKQFKPIYMKYLANKIAKNIDLCLSHHPKNYYVNKIRKISVSGTIVKIKLTGESYNLLF